MSGVDWKRFGKFVSETAAVTTAVLGTAAYAVPAAGFTGAGVAANTIAAAYEGTLGGVITAGGVSSTLQSVAAAGLAGTTKLGVAVVSAAAVEMKEDMATFSKNMSKDDLKDMGKFALKTAAVTGVVLGTAAIVVPAIGFTSGGVAAHSLAAAYQSAYLGGTIASGSAFSVLQSVGAAGLAGSTKLAVVCVSGVAVKKFGNKE